MAGSRPRALTRGRSLPHSQRKQARELLAALQKVVVPIYCTSFLAVEEDKQQKIARVRGAAGRGRGRGAGGGGRGGGGAEFSSDAASPSSPHVQLLQLWEKNGYFDDSIIQQLQSPALGLGQYQVGATSTRAARRDRCGSPPRARRVGRLRPQHVATSRGDRSPRLSQERLVGWGGDFRGWVASSKLGSCTCVRGGGEQWEDGL